MMYATRIAARDLLLRLRTSRDFQDSVLMVATTVVAGGFDYLTNVFSGRLLPPAQFGIFVAVIAMLQVLVHLTNVIRNVVAFYAADLHSKQQPLFAFFGQSWRWALRYGLLSAVAALLLAWPLAGLLRFPSVAPLLVAAPVLLLLFLRPVTDGMLQGRQRFRLLAGVQITQAVARFVFTLLLIWLGWQAAGALLALPLAMGLALLLAWRWLSDVRQQVEAQVPTVSWRYSTLTLGGLLAFALLINMDAILVRRLFDATTAGDYGVVITLGKMNLFVPLALGMVLFPKAVARHSQQRSARKLLLLSLLTTLGAGALLTAVYFAAPATITALLFGGAYSNPGILLGVIGAATTLFAGINIWLNYALSLQNHAYVWLLGAITLGQFIGIVLFHETLLQIGMIMLSAGVLANIGGAALLLNRLPAAHNTTPAP